MLDLGFVRNNLELVEEKLRARWADPAALLGDFRALDAGRREAITTSEQLKARRNELSEQVGTLKRILNGLKIENVLVIAGAAPRIFMQKIEIGRAHV